MRGREEERGNTDQLVLGRANVERGEKDASFGATDDVLAGVSGGGGEREGARTRRDAWKAGGESRTRTADAWRGTAG